MEGDPTAEICHFCGEIWEVLDMYMVVAPWRPTRGGAGGVAHEFTGGTRDDVHICKTCWVDRTGIVDLVKETKV